MKKLIIIGAGGHGKVVADIALLNGYTDIVFFDDDDTKKECAGFPVVGRISDCEDMDTDTIVAIGNAALREKIQKITKNPVTLIHPAATVSNSAKLGRGTVIMAGAIINPYAVIGDGCIINTASTIDHDSVIGDYCHISVGAHLAGNVKVLRGTWIGIGAVISNNITVCADSIIGAGAVVIRDITEPGTYVGVPAKKTGTGS